MQLRQRVIRTIAAVVLAWAGLAWAVQPKQPGNPLDQKEFSQPDLYISSASVPLDQVLDELPNKAAWLAFRAEAAVPIPVCPVCDVEAVTAFIDRRSGTATNILAALPLLPGAGAGNQVTYADLSARLGRRVSEADDAVAADAVRQFALAHRDVLGIDAAQLGEARASRVTPELWQVSIPQTYAGLPVRHGRLAASIKHGNLVLIGAESWGNVDGLDARPGLDADKALEIGFGHADGRSVADVVERAPRLEVVPFAPAELQEGGAYAGPAGRGYGHRLAWTFVFTRDPEPARWEAMVDAHTGELLAFQDINHYVQRTIKGGVYPLTSTGICPSPERCGVMQSNWPMPFADTGFPMPDDFANSGGVYNYTAGVATTTLTGRYVDIFSDTCGALSLSSANGNINLGGSNGQHDCVTPGIGGPGNTAAARTTFYDANKIIEIARGWLPANAWLQGQIRANVNINSSCNAFYNGTINFFKALGGCRNTGEIIAVIDHEWGHGLDDNDTNGFISNPGEAYADIAAVYRSHTSCVGYGFWWTADPGCGMTSDGTGFNGNEAQVGPAHCDVDCSGVRDADYLRHNPNTPDTPLGFVCSSCGGGGGPCGKQVHCAAAPARQAAWDLAARDLQNPPFSYNAETAFIVANKLFYQGSGNIGPWYNCACGVSSDGCGATNAYMQWLTADDDNGNINDGTPHFTAIRAAFDRHRIACASPCAGNCGCRNGPSAAPTLSGTPGVYSASLSWTAVAGATRYWVFRTEGHAGCNFGKALIAEVTGTSYVDTQVAACRKYHYNVVAAGASSACYGRASNCVTVVPNVSTGPVLCAIEEESSAEQP